MKRTFKIDITVSENESSELNSEQEFKQDTTNTTGIENPTPDEFQEVKLTIMYKKLELLEKKINLAFYKSRNPEYWLDTKTGQNYKERWNKLIIKLRGWDEYMMDDNGKDLTKPEWIEYCNLKGLAPHYNFGDILA